MSDVSKADANAQPTGTASLAPSAKSDTEHSWIPTGVGAPARPVTHAHEQFLWAEQMGVISYADDTHFSRAENERVHYFEKKVDMQASRKQCVQILRFPRNNAPSIRAVITHRKRESCARLARLCTGLDRVRSAILINAAPTTHISLIDAPIAQGKVLLFRRSLYCSITPYANLGGRLQPFLSIHASVNA